MNKLQQEIVMFLYEEEQRTGNIYMNKTLSERCLVKFPLQQILWDYAEIIVPLIEILPKDDNWEYLTYLHPNKIISKECLSVNWVVQSWIKIIWHYGIASLEAFFYKKNIELVDIQGWKRIYIDSDFKKFKLRNVEPYLYTEEENKHLLKLLKELWQQ